MTILAITFLLTAAIVFSGVKAPPTADNGGNQESNSDGYSLCNNCSVENHRKEIGNCSFPDKLSRHRNLDPQHSCHMKANINTNGKHCCSSDGAHHIQCYSTEDTSLVECWCYFNALLPNEVRTCRMFEE